MAIEDSDNIYAHINPDLNTKSVKLTKNLGQYISLPLKCTLTVIFIVI